MKEYLMLPNNKEVFKKLIEVYESITEADLMDAYVENANLPHYESQDFLEELTGFGDMQVCTLCHEARLIDYEQIRFTGTICEYCVYVQANNNRCYERNHHKTYVNLKGINLGSKQGRKNFLYALQERAKHMKRVLNQLIKKEKEDDILC